MKAKHFILIAFCINAAILSAQTLGEFKPGKSGPLSLEKPKFDNRNVYIADFAVHYQVYSEKAASKKGGSGLFGAVMGSAKASLAVGLDVSEETLQNITNTAYSQFLADLKEKGFNVMKTEEAKDTEFYKGYQYSDSLKMFPSTTIEGAITVHPQNVGFFYKEKGSTENTTKLSKELNDAAVIRVDLYVEFVKSKGSNKSGIGANVVAKTNLVLSENSTIVHFIVGRNKIGGSPLAEYQGILKKDLDIDGVIKEEKITNYVDSDYDNWGTKTAFGTVYVAKNKATAKAAIVPADAPKYEQGVEQAIDVFLKHHLNEFHSKYFK
ncbi:hypothetical protein GOQ30_08475 [Flavobacterium sp. TP390]|uniref:Curli production assembly/transport component CsgG n=1 Tax=Flavobacterium profundi TaxID=1774945 RepID=A0A6I4IHK5_9FLAO|nr:hypothetical protein [Flavobacterium profundi]MVO09193.1 hypothetical protein [Flavobacterium profundi]